MLNSNKAGDQMKRLINPPSHAAAAICALMAFVGAANGQEATIDLTIKDHRFVPAEAHAPANTPVVIVVKNLDSTPEEFESKMLRVEKLIAGGGSATFRIRPLAPGRYRFFGEYHEDTAEGFLVIE
jgi:hypothetical protein